MTTRDPRGGGRGRPDGLDATGPDRDGGGASGPVRDGSGASGPVRDGSGASGPVRDGIDVTGPGGDDARLATRLAIDAGELLVSIREHARRLAIDRWQLGRYADHRANALILERLAGARPDDAVLSEEEVDDPSRLVAERVWIVDPLDGTRAYMMGRDDWAVHVALWEAGVGLTAAAVSLPAIGRVFSTDTVADLPGLPGTDGPEPLILVSPSRPPMFAPFVAREVGARLATMGSAGFKAMAVLCGGAIAYLHASGQSEWDSAAPVGVLRAAGFHASRIDGSELEYNKPDPHVADFLLCRPDLAEPLLDAIARGRARRLS